MGSWLTFGHPPAFTPWLSLYDLGQGIEWCLLLGEIVP
jgi:hypothetical protein